MSGPTLDEDFLARRVRPRFSRALRQEAVYLANHSLGRPPDRVAEDIQRALDAWYRDMGEAWNEWLAARDRFRELTAKLAGVPRGDSIIPKCSAGQGLRAVLNAFDGRIRVLATDEEFDSLDFILRAYRGRGRIELITARARAEELLAAVKRKADLLVLSTVLFRTGEVVSGLKEIVSAAHAGGCKVLLDVYHHAGALPLDLAALDADFAVGGSYKYTRGGPGACWLYVHPRHQHLRTLDTGWFAKKDAFSYARPEPPQYAAGGDAWLESTPPVLAPVQALAGLEFTLEIGVERLRAHHLAQKRRLFELLKCEGIDAEGEGENYGQFLTVRHPRARELSTALMERKIKTDARGEFLRLCPDLLNTGGELEQAARALASAMR
jgi:kynureninase